MCAGQVCHCVAFIEGNYYVRTDGTVVDAKDPTPYLVIKDMTTGALLDGVRELAEGSDHACALRTDNTVWCWARTLDGNQRGQIGDGTLSVASPRLARQVQITGSTSSAPLFLTDVRSLAHNGYGYGSQSACAVKNDGTVWCWGRNSEGYLFSSQTPVAPPELSFPLAVQLWASPNTPLSGVDQISIGQSQGCAVRSGALYCWGRNYNGALGVGDTTDRVYATAVTGLPATVTKVLASLEFTCALAGGQLYCWGAGLNGQLCDLGSLSTQEPGCSTKCRLAPAPGTFARDGQTGLPISDIKDFVLGPNFTVVIRSDSSIRFFGSEFPHAPAPTDLMGGADNLWQLTTWGSNFPVAVRYMTRDAKYFVGPTMRYPTCQ